MKNSAGSVSPQLLLLCPPPNNKPKSRMLQRADSHAESAPHFYL